MYIHVKVNPGAKKELCERLSETSFTVSVREKAERNMANRRVAEILARELKTPAKRIRLVSGHRSPSKVFAVEAQ
jgi:uncharacterized protein YggU (UPF0235/DUF167 family)